jgi:hypothetical protein
MKGVFADVLGGEGNFVDTPVKYKKLGYFYDRLKLMAIQERQVFHPMAMWDVIQ